MKFELTTKDLTQEKNCLIIGAFEKGQLTQSGAKLDKFSQGYIKKILKQSHFEADIGQILPIYNPPGLKCELILIVGCGNPSTLSASNFRKISTASIKAAAPQSKTVVSFLAELPVEKNSTAWKIRQLIETAADSQYHFAEYKSKQLPKTQLESVIYFIEHEKELKQCERAHKEALAIIQGVEYTKNLANTPSNICTPTYLAEKAKKLAKDYKSISVNILEKKEMEKLGMGAFLSVAKGSAEPPKLICLEYKGATKKSPTVALVGKGITFDTGGISLKPADAMVGMKYDMCGAATVLGTLKAAAILKLPIHLVGLLAAAENMPSGHASKPEDIVTTLSGQTVEIMNTDAEGRLVLCDTLTYCERFKPDAVIDIATLTGAVVIALGHHATGLLSNHEPLAEALLTAGIEAHDRAWQLPLWDEYQEQLKSPFADMSNVGGKPGGTITAGCFLSRFTKQFHWAHLDVAGTAAMMGGPERYATGRPVPLLMQYLINKCS